MYIIEDYMTKSLKLGGSELLVFAVIASGLDSTRYFTKTQPYIAKMTGLSLCTVHRAIKSLEQKRIIGSFLSRDGDKVVKLIRIISTYSVYQDDAYFMDVVNYYQDKIAVNVDINSKAYNAYKFAIDKIKKQFNEEYNIYDAIDNYAKMIFDKSYFKSYKYNFESFCNKSCDYLLGGNEYSSWIMFQNNN